MSERPGVLIGINNVLTGQAARVVAGPDLDGAPELRDRLQVQAVRTLEGREAFIHDAVIGGRRVRLYSNSHHLADFWRESWPGEGEWLRERGQAILHAPVLTVYAMIGVAAEPAASYVSVKRAEAYLFNTSYYGDLRALTMEALGRLPGEHGLRLVHGAAFELQGRGILVLYPKEVVHPTPTWGIMELPAARFLADGWIAVDGEGRLRAVEKGLYLRTSFVEHYPEYAGKILPSKFENVPDPGPDDPARAAQVETAVKSDSRGALRVLPPAKAREVFLRLVASRDSRAIVPPESLFGRDRVVPGPLVPAAAFGLKTLSEQALRPAKLDSFPCPGYEVHTGAVQGHPRELARLIARTAGTNQTV